jgi:hypothetical protein
VIAVRQVDDAVNAFRRAVERAIPWYDPDAEAEANARVEALSERIEQGRQRSIRARIAVEGVIADYRRGDGAMRR